MKWCRFNTGDKIAYGIIEGDQVIEVDGTPFDTYTKTSNVQPLSAVKLEVPVIPPTFYAAGINYPEHITWAAEKVGTQPDIPKNADVGYRAVNALVPTEHPIEVPKDAHEDLQYEGELVAVIGKKCKNVTEAQALDYVLGFTIGNDVSERTTPESRDSLQNIRMAKTIAATQTGERVGLRKSPRHQDMVVPGLQ